jgi:hypothetical protein
MNSHDLSRALYRYRRVAGDLRAIAKGRYPQRVARRFVYRHAHRTANTVARKLLAKVGL